MQTGVACCNVPSKFSETHGLQIYLFNISSSSSVQDTFSHIEGEYNDGDFNLRINVYVHLAKSVAYYGTTLGQGMHSLHFSCPDLFSGPTLYVGRQTMVFTECKLKFSPLFYQFIKQNRLRPGST